jgi:hypothetical protein
LLLKIPKCNRDYRGHYGICLDCGKRVTGGVVLGGYDGVLCDTCVITRMVSECEQCNYQGC